MAGVLLRPVWPVARREGRRHHPRPWGSDRRATKPQAKLAQPNGRQSFSLQASLLAPHRSTAGYARRSRLAWSEKPLPQNTSHLGDTTLAFQRRVGSQVTPNTCGVKTLSIAILALAGVLWSPVHAAILVSTNSSWKFHKGTGEASSPTNAWRAVAFDDSTWNTGAAPFYYDTDNI